MTKTKKPPRLKEKRIMISAMIQPEFKRRLKMAATDTGLSQSEYIERALATQLTIDYGESD